MKKSAPPQSTGPKGAPAYMGQYASLMTILLAFFIVMLTLGQDRASKFRDGVGQIRNLIGLQGGTGVLEFWRSMRYPPAPQVDDKTTEDDDANLIGYQMDARDAFSLQSEALMQILIDDPSKDIRLNTKIDFEPGRVLVRRDTQSSLDHITTLLHSVDAYRVDVEVWGENDAESRHLAARRAVWITRHLVENARMQPNRIRAIGLVRDIAPAEPQSPEPRPRVTILLRK